MAAHKLSRYAAEVVAGYFVYHGHGSAASGDDMLRPLHVDPDLPASKIPPQR